MSQVVQFRRPKPPRPRASLAAVEAAGGYQLIYADPPTGYRNKARGAADDHYMTMTMEQLKRVPVARLAARDAVLFLWTTWPFLVEKHQSHDLMVAWGFEPRTVGFVWVKLTSGGKEHVGNGFWTRSNTEVCLIGVRGKMRRAANEGPPASVRQLFLERVEAGDLEPEAIDAQVGEHSAKPAVFRQRVEQLMGPGLSMLEMYARERHDGWDAHGNQVPGGPDVGPAYPGLSGDLPIRADEECASCCGPASAHNYSDSVLGPDGTPHMYECLCRGRDDKLEPVCQCDGFSRWDWREAA